MYVFFIVLIIIASFLIILSVLAQNPKSGMAANFGASNQVMGVRQTADFLEKLTWGLAVAIVVLSLAATMAMPRADITRSNDALQQAIENQAAPIQNFQLQNNAGTVPTPQEETTPAETPAE
ncbi:preprotein translocase subunit SecG [uncultured Rikenella sp.]|uniref:preprotein translocase subunit SecG n=1 Tax=uncultured Rikenella sp. TaxID=368003 RepID=UPI00260DD109|nr:preprotein translocase subunit SecG [uncultured Rikenella sp.]